MPIPDVPVQYKQIVDECVIDLADTAERLWPIVGELCATTLEVEAENLVIIIKRKNNGTSKKIN